MIENLKRFTENLIAQGPEACKKFLIRLGTLNEDGTLSKNYYPEGK